MINIQSNVQEVFKNIAAKILKAGNATDLSLALATNMLPEVKKRIHVDGKDATGNEIGRYSNAYMRVRTGQFKTNAKFSKGKNKGETKPTGVFTKGKDKGKQRPNYNRTGDTKVIASLTRQMENDFSVIADDTIYGLGYNNEDNTKKAGYVEATYEKKIYALTDFEKDKTGELASAFVNDNLK